MGRYIKTRMMPMYIFSIVFFIFKLILHAGQPGTFNIMALRNLLSYRMTCQSSWLSPC
jgi:hypothetical protein